MASAFRRKVAALIVAIGSAVTPAPLGAEIIDRVLAVVEGHVITLSDARAALQLGLVPADVSTDPIRAAMQRLIDRWLMLADVERYAPPEPPAAAVDSALKAIESRYKDALAFEIALNQTALSREELRRYLRDTLRIDAYVRQRFASATQAAEDEIVRYYQEHQADFSAGGRLRPLDDVREEIRTRLADAQRETFVRQWVESLRRRGTVQVVYLPRQKR